MRGNKSNPTNNVSTNGISFCRLQSLKSNSAQLFFSELCSVISALLWQEMYRWKFGVRVILYFWSVVQDVHCVWSSSKCKHNTLKVRSVHIKPACSCYLWKRYNRYYLWKQYMRCSMWLQCSISTGFALIAIPYMYLCLYWWLSWLNIFINQICAIKFGPSLVWWRRLDLIHSISLQSCLCCIIYYSRKTCVTFILNTKYEWMDNL